MAFQKGQSGNPNGRPKTKLFKEALDRAIAKSGDESISLDEIARALLVKAKGGDVQAIKELADRYDGKVAQEVEMSGNLHLSHEDALGELE